MMNVVPPVCQVITLHPFHIYVMPYHPFERQGMGSREVEHSLKFSQAVPPQLDPVPSVSCCLSHPFPPPQPCVYHVATASHGALGRGGPRGSEGSLVFSAHITGLSHRPCFSGLCVFFLPHEEVLQTLVDLFKFNAKCLGKARKP